VSLSSLLSIARSALSASQLELDVTGHNIANATTDGYTRQSARLVASTPLATPVGDIGTGVTVAGIDRARSSFLDGTYRSENSLLGEYGAENDTLSSVQSLLSEPSSQGLASSLDAFWASWSDLANDPTGSADRVVVRQRGQSLAAQLNTLAGQVDQQRADVLAQLNQDVASVNSIAARVADLNRQIAAAESGGKTAPDLEDARDLALDQLSDLAPVRVIARNQGSTGVYVGDTLVVDGGTVRTLAVRTNADGTVGVGLTDTSQPLDLSSGRLKAETSLLSSDLPALTSELDDIARSLVTTVNAVHETGYTAAGQTGVDFFDPTGMTAASIALSQPVLQSADAVAASATGAPGDASVAQRIAALQNAPAPDLGGRTINAAYNDLVTALGSAVSDAQSRQSAQQTLVTQVQSQRSSTSGVSVDEELVNLITYQQSYVAATRVVTAADQMMQYLLQAIQ
jgi:flagellar hook-associated protein 1 FlgK